MILSSAPTVEHPRHLVDEDVVEAEWRVVPEDSDEVLNEFHVHVLEAATVELEHQGHGIAVLLPAISVSSR